MSVREHWINVRVNPEELARIREKQKELGIRNTGAYMRKMAMDGAEICGPPRAGQTRQSLQ